MDTTFFSLATKSSFNKALRHFYKVTDLVDDVDCKRNFADVVNAQIEEDEMVADQILPAVGAILKDKFAYSYSSFNIPLSIRSFEKIYGETAKWTALDIVIVYYNPNGLVFLINPKNPDHWERTGEIARDQMSVIYAKHRKEGDNKKVEQDAISAIREMLSGKDVFISKDFVDASVTPAAVVKKAPTAPAGKRKTTPLYSVQVTNELFHNGNVEAWKKIIESYLTKHPGLEVVVFYENERINDLNTLFSWGKVKHDGLIMFQVIGEDICDVSKLQKYLFEGASRRFEQFLKIGVGQVLNLF